MKKTLLTAAMLALVAGSTIAQASPERPVVTFNLRNLSSHKITIFLNEMNPGETGECIGSPVMSPTQVICTADEKGQLIYSGGFFYDGNFNTGSAPLTVSNSPEWLGVAFGGTNPPPAVVATLSDGNWDGKSDMTYTVTFKDRS